MKILFAGIALSVGTSLFAMQNHTCTFEVPGLGEISAEISVGNSPSWKLIQDTQVLVSNTDKDSVKEAKSDDPKKELEDLLKGSRLQVDTKLISELSSLEYLKLEPVEKGALPAALLIAKGSESVLRKWFVEFGPMGRPILHVCK